MLTRGFIDAFKHLVSEGKQAVRHRQGSWRARRFHDRSDLRLNFGCGQNQKPGWLNIDFAPNADLAIDLRERLPFEDGSCVEIYSEHVLEHFEYPVKVNQLLAECFRVLKPGGTFSAGVPDTEWPLWEYAGLTTGGYFEYVKEAWHPPWCVTRMEHINHHFRQDGEHKFAYDEETLTNLLRRAGFVDVRVRPFDPRMDSIERRVGTIYATSRKPLDSPVLAAQA